MNHSDDHIPDELKQVAARLREERATATALELDQFKLRAMKQADRSRPGLYARQKGQLMKSRFALTMVIATGMLMSTGGVTLAVSGSSGSGSAAEGQYQPAGGGAALGGAGSGSVPSPSEQVTAASTDSGSLPFTGFAAIPLLILGVGFLTVGLVMRLRLNRSGT